MGRLQEGGIGRIRCYCETDAANTYLMFLRFQAMRGALTADADDAECELVRSTLGRSVESHWQQFLSHLAARLNGGRGGKPPAVFVKS